MPLVSFGRKQVDTNSVKNVNISWRLWTHKTGVLRASVFAKIHKQVRKMKFDKICLEKSLKLKYVFKYWVSHNNNSHAKDDSMKTKTCNHLNMEKSGRKMTENIKGKPQRKNVPIENLAAIYTGVYKFGHQLMH